MKRVLRGRSGSGIVNVIVAFAVIITIALSFYQTARMAARLINKAEYTNAEIMAVVESYYYGSSVPEPPQPIAFTGEDGTFSITTNATAYDEERIPGDAKVYYFGE